MVSHANPVALDAFILVLWNTTSVILCMESKGKSS